MLCKTLEPGWESNLKAFLEALTVFMQKSDSIGLINFHLLTHSAEVCKKYSIGLGALGCDSTIEAYHSHVMTEIEPNLGKAPVILDNSLAYTVDNMPPEHMSQYYRNLFGRALEISLHDIDCRDLKLKHCDYSKNLIVNKDSIKKFLDELHLKEQHFELKKKSVKFDENLKKYLEIPLHNFVPSLTNNPIKKLN